MLWERMDAYLIWDRSSWAANWLDADPEVWFRKIKFKTGIISRSGILLGSILYNFKTETLAVHWLYAILDYKVPYSTWRLSTSVVLEKALPGCFEDVSTLRQRILCSRCQHGYMPHGSEMKGSLGWNWKLTLYGYPSQQSLLCCW